MNSTRANSILKKGVPGKYSAGNGLYLRISNEGTGFWLVRYSFRGKRHEITLGQYPELSLADANVKTREIKQGIRKKIDPLVQRRRESMSQFQVVDDLANDWLADCEKRLKHPGIPRRVYRKDISPSIGFLGLDEITPRDVRAVIRNIASSGRPSVANDALLHLKQIFCHGIKLDLIQFNPADAFALSDAGGVEKSRSRALSIEELSEVFACFREYSDQFARENYLAVALLVTLGVRKGELTGARWQEFDQKSRTWKLPSERSKTSQSITIPLPDEAMSWLEELYVRACGSEYVFPKRRASKRQGHMSLDTINRAIIKLFHEEKLTVEHFTVHDLRRTCRSLLASIGIPGHIAERCLNHKIKGAEGIYDRYDYLDERREALQNLATMLSPIINPESNVVSFRADKTA